MLPAPSAGGAAETTAVGTGPDACACDAGAGGFVLTPNAVDGAGPWDDAGATWTQPMVRINTAVAATAILGMFPLGRSR